MPRRRRRGAKAAAIEAEEERGLVMRIFLHSPKDMLAGLLALAAICAIVANALFLQAGRHPVADVRLGRARCRRRNLPSSARCRARARSRPMRRSRSCRRSGRVEVRAADPKATELRSGDPWNPRQGDDDRHRWSSRPARPPRRHANRRCGRRRLIPATAQSHRRAPRGGGAARADRIWLRPVEGRPARSAPTPRPRSQKFERERKLPVTGQMSDRLVRELTADDRPSDRLDVRCRGWRSLRALAYRRSMRLKSSIWVAAYLRRCQTEGVFGAVRRRGAEEAGAVFVKVALLDGNAMLYAPAPQTVYDESRPVERFFAPVSPQPVPEQSVEERLAKEIRFDPDAWIVETEDRAGRHFLDLAKA